MKRKKTKKRKKAKGRGKGPKWERDTSRALSIWWSRTKDDDLFWRTHGSGARATMRTKSGKKTRGQYGDICAIDHRGATLTKAFTISLKRGYTGKTFQELVDALERPDQHGSIPEQEYAGWIREAIIASHDADSICWMIIARRDNRLALVLIPSYLKQMLRGNIRKALDEIVPQISILTWVRRNQPLTKKEKMKMKRKKIKRWNKRSAISIAGYLMDDFLGVVNRKVICELVKRNSE